MPSIEETAGEGYLSQLLENGYETLSADQEITFKLYRQVVLPSDGYVFWVKQGPVIQVRGSLHYSTDKEQNEDETIGINRVILTTSSEVTELNQIAPETIYLGEYDGLVFSFYRHGGYYEQADLWHYVGDAVYPAFRPQILESADDLAGLDPIISNSLPIWLKFNSMGRVYPSFLVPNNIVPPYVVAHIDPASTKALQQFPSYFAEEEDENGFANVTFWQLMSEQVKLTLYGFNNQTALQFMSRLIEYSVNEDAFGFMTSPVVKDDRRTQREISAVAQKKYIEFEVSYYQNTATAIGKQFILETSFTLGD